MRIRVRDLIIREKTNETFIVVLHDSRRIKLFSTKDLNRWSDETIELRRDTNDASSYVTADDIRYSYYGFGDFKVIPRDQVEIKIGPKEVASIAKTNVKVNVKVNIEKLPTQEEVEGVLARAIIRNPDHQRNQLTQMATAVLKLIGEKLNVTSS